MIKILFLAANPLDMNRLQLEEELRVIDEKLHDSTNRNSLAPNDVALHSHWAARADDIQKVLLRYRPHIVHFSGHGAEACELRVEDEGGELVSLSAEALSQIFQPLKGQVRCVVLNACYSAPQAQAIAEQVDVVVGIPNESSAENSTHFVATLYRALAAGKDVQTAFDLARAAMQPYNRTESGEEIVPQLLAHCKKPAQVTLGTGILQPGSYVWGLLTIVSLSIAIYYVREILFRWMPIDQANVSSTVSAIQIALTVAALLFGLGNEWGRRTVRSAWERITQRYPKFQNTRMLFFATTALALLLAIGFHAGTPRLAYRYALIGNAYVNLGREEDALRAFERAARLEPDNACWHYNLGFIYAAKLDDNAAIKAYEKAKSLNQYYPPIYNNLGRLYLKKADTVEEGFRNLDTGLQYLMKGNHEQGGICATDPNQYHLHRAIFLKNLGLYYLVVDNPAEARTELDDAAQALAEYQQAWPQSDNTLHRTEILYYQALVFEKLDLCAESQQAWRNVTGLADSIRKSKDCTLYGGLVNYQCADAAGWIAEATKRLSAGSCRAD